VGLGTGPAQSAAIPPHAWDKQPCLPRPTSVAHIYTHLHIFIFPFIPFRGNGGRSQSLPSLWNACWAFSMEYLSYGRCNHCAQGPASLCMSTLVCFPSFPCGGGVRVCVSVCVFVCVCGMATVFAGTFASAGAQQLI
jgi:hypothetical protein